MIEKIKEHAWSWVGKAAALLGLILLGLQLADRIGKPEYKVAAHAVRYPMVVPGTFDQAVRKLMTSVQQDTAQVVVSTDELAFMDSFLRQQQVILVTVANRGQRELSNVVLETSTEGYFSTFPGRSIEQVRSEFESIPFGRTDQSVSSFESDVSVGSLRPANQVTLVLWTTSPLWFSPEEYRVTHPFGVSSVDFADDERDWFDYFGFIVLLTLLGFVPLAVWGVRSEKQQREQIQRIEEKLENLAATAVSESSRS